MNRLNRFRPTPSRLALAVLLLSGAGAAQAQPCTDALAYVDLQTGTIIEDVANGLDVLQMHQIVKTPFNKACVAKAWKAAVIEVTIPPQCDRAVVWVQYQGAPVGWTANIGDSESNNGFGGDFGSFPLGQNAEVDVLDHRLTVWNAADNPQDVEQLLTQNLALTDGSLNFVVADQSVSLGQPFSKLATPDLDRLFFLPASPQAPDNRTFYVGLNRVVDPIGGKNTSRNGCGARRALVTFE